MKCAPGRNISTTSRTSKSPRTCSISIGILQQKSGRFEPDKFEDQYEAALVDLINTKRSGKPVTAKARPRGENVVDLMDALRQSIDQASSSLAKPAKKPRKAAAGQKEMLMPIQGKKVAKETAAKKPASKQHKSA